MPRTPLGKEQKKEIEGYLKTYILNKKLLGIERYHKDYFPSKMPYLDMTDAKMLDEAPLARARMFSIRHFILDLPNSDEKLFLYYHYIKGESTERCAELLGISRRSAFRMRNRALEMAYNKFCS